MSVVGDKFNAILYQSTNKLRLHTIKMKIWEYSKAV
jgi:hypothetical protein